MASKVEYKGRRALIFNRDTREFKDVDVLGVKNGCVETIDAIYPENEGILYFDTGSQQIVYVFNIDESVKVEADTLKELRRNVVLSRLFDFKMDKPFDIFALLPWVVIILLVIFK